MKKISRFLILLIAAVSFFGCAATQRMIDYSSMKTDVAMGESIFLTPSDTKTILVQVKNTSSNQNITSVFEPIVLAGLQSRGYKVVQKPSEAAYLLQTNIRYIGEWKQGMDFSGTLTGAGLGALAGLGLSSPNHYGSGALAGGIIGSVVGFVADAATRVKTALIVIDIQIAERISAEQDVFGIDTEEAKTVSSAKSLGGMGTSEEFPSTTIAQKKVSSKKAKVYTTAVAAKAAQVNLDVNEAYKVLIETAGRQVAGIF